MSARFNVTVAVTLAAALALVLHNLIVLLVYTPVAHDQSWFLYAAERVLDGTRLYGPDLTETNPPLVIWASMVPAVISRWTHLESVAVLKAALAVASIASAVWSCKLLRRSGFAMTPVTVTLWAAVAIGVELHVSAGQASFQLGQREQWLFILLLPYVFAALCRSRISLRPFELTSIGIVAGVAVCLKPHHLIVVAALEGFLAISARNARRVGDPALLSLLVTVSCYPLLIQLLARSYIAETVPLLLNTYWAYGAQSSARLVFGDWTFNALFAATCLTWLLCRTRLHLALAAPALMVCSLAASVAYGIQRTGWSYQAIPRDGFLYLALLWIAFEIVSEPVKRLEERPSFTTGFRIATVLLATTATLLAAQYRTSPEAASNAYAEELLADSPPGTPVYILSTALGGFEAVFRKRLAWSSRYACLWLLPAIIANERAVEGGPPPGKLLPRSTVMELASLQRTSTSEDIQRWKPSVILVERCGAGGCQAIDDPQFDLVDWFTKDPAFTSEWRHYCRRPGNDRYDVYQREKDALGCRAEAVSTPKRD
jgi:hypothetical protein